MQQSVSESGELHTHRAFSGIDVRHNNQDVWLLCAVQASAEARAGYGRAQGAMAKEGTQAVPL